MNVKEWLVAVVEGLRGNPPKDFAGIGLVLCEPGVHLPITSLVPPTALPKLPVSGIHDAIEFLGQVSSRQSPFHDGFHLIDARDPRVIGVSYFLAPPIPDNTGIEQFQHPIGARQMAALLGSRIKGVSLILTIDPSMVTSLFIGGYPMDFQTWINGNSPHVL